MALAGAVALHTINVYIVTKTGVAATGGRDGVASLHGRKLATAAPDSPHRYAPRLKADLYIAVADGDHSYPPAMAERFETALDQAGVRYRAETYGGAAHGWMKPDFPVYDQAAAERGWHEMLAFFDRNLKQRAAA